MVHCIIVQVRNQINIERKTLSEKKQSQAALELIAGTNNYNFPEKYHSQHTVARRGGRFGHVFRF